MTPTATLPVFRTLAAACTLALTIAAGCTYDHGSIPSPCAPITVTPTYNAVVAPLFTAHCLECHSAAVALIKGGGNDFSDYKHVKEYPLGSDYLLRTMQHAPGADPMPQGREKLSECDIALIAAWIQAGQPEK